MDEYNDLPQAEETPESPVPAEQEPQGEQGAESEAQEEDETQEPPRKPGAGFYEWLQLFLGCVVAAVERYLPELRPDFVQVLRLAVLDAGGGVFR